MPRPRRQVNRGFRGNLLNPLLAIVAPGIEAVLHFSLVIDGIEGPIAKRRQDDDGDNGGDIAAPA
jgi:hypothetical protein